MRPRMSFALVTFVSRSSEASASREKNILVWWTPPPMGSAAPASFLDFFFFPKRPVSTPPDVRWLV